MSKYQSDFTWYLAALAGNRGPIHDGEPMHGYYRQRTKAGTYEPVMYWRDSVTGELRCHRNGREAPEQWALEKWPYISKNLITAEAYWHFMDTGQWLDNDQAANDVAKGPEIDPATDPAGSLAAEIAAAKAGLAAYNTIESDEAMARAQTLRSALTGLAGKATKEYEALNRPLLDEQQRIRKVWFPLRDDAEGAAKQLSRAMAAWNDVKLQAARRAREEQEKAQREADQKAAAEAEAHRLAVAAAEKASQPPPPAPEPVKVAPVTPNAPPPSSVIKGATGRAASVRIKKVVTAIDLDKAFAQFRNQPELYAVLLDLTQKAVTAGIACEGATVEEKSDIR